MARLSEAIKGIRSFQKFWEVAQTPGNSQIVAAAQGKSGGGSSEDAGRQAQAALDNAPPHVGMEKRPLVWPKGRSRVHWCGAGRTSGCHGQEARRNGMCAGAMAKKSFVRSRCCGRNAQKARNFWGACRDHGDAWRRRRAKGQLAAGVAVEAGVFAPHTQPLCKIPFRHRRMSRLAAGLGCGAMGRAKGMSVRPGKVNREKAFKTPGDASGAAGAHRRLGASFDALRQCYKGFLASWAWRRGYFLSVGFTLRMTGTDMVAPSPGNV